MQILLDSFVFLTLVMWFWHARGVFESIRRQGRTDFLTGLANRLGLSEFSRKKFHDMTSDRFAVLHIDLNGFKTVNDTYGHEAGDEVLRRLSGAFSRKLSAQDFIARVGGDEFVVVLVEAGIKEARETADRLRRCSQEEFPDKKIDLSIGMAVYPDDGDSMNALVKTADERMYLDKKAASTHEIGREYNLD